MNNHWCKHCLGPLPNNMDFMCSCELGKEMHRICVDCHQEKRANTRTEYLRELLGDPLSRTRIEKFWTAFGTIAMSDQPRGNA